MEIRLKEKDRPHSPVPRRPPQMPLAACMAVLFALSAPVALAGTVTRCADSGTDSLRDTVAQAASGDTIDFDLPASCNSTITLVTGAIQITQPSLSIKSFGDTRVTITGNNQGSTESDRIFNHTGKGGALYLRNLDITYGAPYGIGNDVSGGCIFTAGTLRLYYSSVTHCAAHVHGTGLYVYGGGIYTVGSAFISGSTVSDNTAGYGQVAGSAGAQFAYGGGIFTVQGLYLFRSTLSNNRVHASSAAAGGGASVDGNGSVSYSTISGNISSGNFGGIVFAGNGIGTLTQIIRSTISGNSASGAGGGLVTLSAIGEITGSTIAFNSAGLGKLGGQYLSPGAALNGTGGYFRVNGALLWNNTYGSSENDFSARFASTQDYLSHSIAGASKSGLAFLTGCPLLGPLRNNGGPTFTHALSSGSAAIDVAGLMTTAKDQRDLAAPSPAGGSIDVGAYEVQQDDIIFNVGFEGCG